MGDEYGVKLSLADNGLEDVFEVYGRFAERSGCPQTLTEFGLRRGASASTAGKKDGVLYSAGTTRDYRGFGILELSVQSDDPDKLADAKDFLDTITEGFLRGAVFNGGRFPHPTEHLGQDS